MFVLRKPLKDYVRRFLSSQSVLQFSYGEVGASREGVLPKVMLWIATASGLGRERRRTSGP